MFFSVLIEFLKLLIVRSILSIRFSGYKIVASFPHRRAELRVNFIKDKLCVGLIISYFVREIGDIFLSIVCDRGNDA